MSKIKVKEEEKNKSNNNNYSDKEDLLINNDLYLNIDSKYALKGASKDDIEFIRERIQTFQDDKSYKDEISKEKLTQYITQKFLDKLFPKCESNVRKISLSISREIQAIKKLTLEIIENNIDYFYSIRHEIKYLKSLKLTKERFRNIGYILCFIYPKITKFKIKESSEIKKYLKEVVKNNNNINIKNKVSIDVLTDYFFYCGENGIDPSQIKKTKVWEILIKKYEVPPELIFLVNLFGGIKYLVIDIDFEGEKLDNEDIKLFTITILNTSFIFPFLDHVSLNFIHNKLQFSLYERYYSKIINLLKLGEETIKKNIIRNHNLIYNKKWDFEHDFNLEEYSKNQMVNQNNLKIVYDEYSILYYLEENDNKNKQEEEKKSFFRFIYKNKDNKSRENLILSQNNDFNIDEFNSDDEIDNDVKSSRTQKNYRSNTFFPKKKNNNNNNENEKKIQYKDVLEENAGIFDIILMTICCITKIDSIKELDLISNDFYNLDFVNYLKKCYKLDAASIDDEYHILDMLYKAKKFELLNIEINSLDIMTFDKIICIIYKNEFLKSLKISFFSSDVSYFIITIFKVYEEIKKSEDIIKYALKERSNLSLESFEKKILDELSTYFIKDLFLLFEIIKSKKNLEELGLNFDIPNILLNNKNYKVPIFKFLLNIIFLIDNNEFLNKNKIKKLTLLSPNTIFDNRKEYIIDEIFKEIRIFKNCKQLKELNVQFQFYEIKYLKNIISSNLVILSIGDLDLLTFEELVNYLISYNFSKKSALTHLSIKILKKINYFSTELKMILRNLFSIKIKNLTELKLFTDIIIDNKAKYIYLMEILRNNWIPYYTITLNEISNNTISKYNKLKQNLPFLVPRSLETKIFKENELKAKKKDSNFYVNEEMFYALKYLFTYRYTNNTLGFFEIKNIIFIILKYIYLTSNIKILHKLDQSYDIN